LGELCEVAELEAFYVIYANYFAIFIAPQLNVGLLFFL